MKKYISKSILVASVVLATACVDDITSLNVNPKAYQSGLVPEGPFFANASRNVVDEVTYGMSFKIWAQHFAETTYFTTSNYTLTDVGSGFWSSLYQSVLNDYKESKKILLENPSFYAGVDKNKLAQIEIMEVYTYSLLVTTFGDIPYSGALNPSLKSEALDPENLTPGYDDGEEVYSDLLNRLNSAIDNLDPAVDNGGDLGFGASDLLFGDDINLWIKFANSLKLRMGIIISDSNPSLAKSVVESINVADLISSNDEIAQLQYLATTPNTNPIWVGLIQSGREDYVASNTMMNIMEEPAVDDPRITEYYTVDNYGGYSGGTYGTSNAYVNFSKAGAKVTSPTWPGIIIDYTEVEFLLAEALAKGFSVGGTIAEHYENGIRASMDYWDVDESVADLYIADPDVAYATAIGGNDIQKIARQKYIAMFNRGFESWGDYRRFGYPVYNVPPNPGGPFPLRYTYPVSEQTSNGEKYTEAAAAIGGDDLNVKLFWDVN